MERILNCGCGNDTYGTDFTDKYPQRKEVKKCNLDTQKLPFPDNYFDIVYSKNLFEHLTNLGFTMKEMKRVLKRGGKLIIITDNANFWGYAFGKTHLGLYEEMGSYGGEDRHYELFTDWHMQNHARNAGFRKIRTVYTIDNLIGIKGNIIFLTNILFRHTPLKRMVHNIIKMEAIK